MNEKRSEAERILGEMIKEAIDHSAMDLNLFSQLKPALIPSAETFMPRRRRNGKNWIIPAVGITVACSTLILTFFRAKKK